MRRWVAAGALLTWLAATAHGAPLSWERIVMSGQPSPTGATIDRFDTVEVTGEGRVYFIADVGPGRPLLRWSAASGVHTVIAATSDVVAGTDPPIAIASQGDDRWDPRSLEYRLLRDGSALVVATAITEACAAGSIERGVVAVAGRDESPDVVLQSGALLPALGPGWILDGAIGEQGSNTPWDDARGVPAMNRAGELAFVARAIRADVPCAWYDDPSVETVVGLFGPDGAGGTALAALLGAAIPGPDEATLRRVSGVLLNERGELAFLAVRRPAAPGPDAYAIYRWSASSGLALVATAGTAVSGGRTLSLPIPIRLDDEGAILFVDEGSQGGIYEADASNAIRAIAQTGNPAVGIPGEQWMWFSDEDTSTAKSGLLAFTGWLTPRNAPESTTAVWVEGPGGALALRAGPGTAAPGGGVATDASLMRVRDDGRALIWMQTDRRIGGLPEEIFLASDPGGAFDRLVGQRDEFDFGAGSVAAAFIDGLSADAELRRIAVTAIGAEQSALFLSTVPEPFSAASASVSIVSLVCLATLRRRR